MQGHIILVVEPGLVLQWSQWISPRHAEANNVYLVRVVLAGCYTGTGLVPLTGISFGIRRGDRAVPPSCLREPS
jgi:hypothetical protein